MSGSAHSTRESSLSVEELSVKYGTRQVIDNLTLAPIRAGRITAILGPNGSGKSTLLRAIAGLTPSHGKISLGEHKLSSLAQAKRAQLSAYLPQTLPPTVHLQVLEAVMVARRAGDAVSAELALDESVAILERLGIAALALRYMDELSGGQRQLVGLAQALVRRPSLLLLDEPLSALDLHYQIAVMEAVRHETEMRNLVTLIVVHDLNIALQRASDVVYVKEGKLIAQGGVKTVTTPKILADIYGVKARIEMCSRNNLHILVDEVV
ncbi:ATP-binding cassette domain-containing protein [Aristophania vespae]|uniref:ATP-binding cassette domain-containing protein n=1 Tax=Aristophania vespae TaxID=2697033 RepID=A0A6P1NFT9_9PROT|nr:ABC transporter ATP-binding protein [Aristophania vespae]QHI95390.1 ATP-binding cassette domain-containing protein [Aristophania vespae]UMM64669.1 Ferric enterobactin transport ATP-binding protein FepC [Aristophania vespae]